MNVLLTGKNMVLTDVIEGYARQKFQRLARYRPDLDRADVELTQQATRDVQDHYVGQANLIAEGRLVLRGEERAADPHVVIDALVDLLEQQLQRQHERIESRRRVTFQGHLPPTPPEAFERPSPLETVLAEYDVDSATIIHLEERGIRTMEQLRALVDTNSLAERLGPGWEHQTGELAEIVDKLRL